MKRMFERLHRHLYDASQKAWDNHEPDEFDDWLVIYDAINEAIGKVSEAEVAYERIGKYESPAEFFAEFEAHEESQTERNQ